VSWGAAPERPTEGISFRLRFAALVLPAFLVIAYVGLDYFVLEATLPRGPSHVALAVIGIAGVVTFSVVIFGRLAEIHAHEVAQRETLEELTAQLEAKRVTLQALNAAGLSLSAELASELVLQKIADLARGLANARYAALGVFDADGRIAQFWTAGIGEDERARIGDPPEGHGILGLLPREGRPIRLRDLASHPAAVGFPPGHPPMRSFLGVPVLWRGRSVGNLYLTEKIGAEEFSADDEAALVTLAAQAAIAIENARLYEQASRVSVLEERHRIGMDLHDGAMQTLYGLGLLIESAAEEVHRHPEIVRQDLGRAVDRLNAAIADLRSYVLGLRPIGGNDGPLAESLPALVEQIASNALLVTTVNVAPEAEGLLDREAREAIFYVAADALGNIARHARAHRVSVHLGVEHNRVVLDVADDGVGFESGRAMDGFGLRNMRERAFAVGGLLRVETAPRKGTRVRLELPVKEGEP